MLTTVQSSLRALEVVLVLGHSPLTSKRYLSNNHFFSYKIAPKAFSNITKHYKK
jgi:hypothetical protein